ncbi:McrB family protein [Sphingobacterium wenxiniae]|uniref:AAA domain (Dynein-related subfamily) n=1 Tax=Sphingobacterium wenxiniae TaxID=683125 RepID=A0A1I6NZ67_9SPHI|nr:AAA family ATPase [Sphingobacterium wenxiniae]SFS33118.1 AAA domain (dynein-related subfamily) [Sphingobacterium wenxiniae]
MTEEEKNAWAKAFQYAFQYLDDNPWDPLNNPKNYAIEFNGKYYPNKQILKYAEEYLQKNFPEFLDVPRLSGGKPINDFLASKGANAVTLKVTNESVNELQKLFDTFNPMIYNLGWYSLLKKYTDIMQQLKSEVVAKVITSYEILNQRFKELAEDNNDDFLDRYLFIKKNGLASISQQVIKIDNRDQIRSAVNERFSRLEEILSSIDKRKVYNLTHKLVNQNALAVLQRFTRAMFPNEFTSIDASNHFTVLKKILRNQFGIKLKSKDSFDQQNEVLSLIDYTDVYKAQMFFWALKSGDIPSNSSAEIKSQEMNHPLNQILFGPPGTGKTYNSIDKAVNIATGQSGTHAENKVEFDRLRKEGQIEFVTFHQGYSYEDFMVGIKPNTDREQLTFKPHKGIFYSLVERAKANYIAHKDQKQELTSFDTVFEKLIAPLEDGQTIEIPMKGGNPLKITKVETSGIIRFIKPGGSSNTTLNLDNLREYFNSTKKFNGDGLATYYEPIVKHLKERQQPVAVRTALKKFVIIIDEINRANISKVFGELITLLEDDKRMGAENALSLTLPNGETDFSIPPNVHIISTMNTADKSIALVDIALRRRFEFEGYYPDYNALAEPSLTILQKINEAIYTRKKTADFLIGHGYFMKGEPLDTILIKKIIPLLMEYFSGRTEEVKEILKAADINAEYSTLNYRWHIHAITIDETHK